MPVGRKDQEKGIFFLYAVQQFLLRLITRLEEKLFMTGSETFHSAGK